MESGKTKKELILKEKYISILISWKEKQFNVMRCSYTSFTLKKSTWHVKSYFLSLENVPRNFII